MPNPSPTPRQHFNSRPSARGDSHAHRSRQQTQKFQFTPLREGRRIRFKSTIFPSRISIHAPPRGATDVDDCGQVRRRAISIHAPPRGATMRFRQATGRTTFQFTPLREGRLLANPVLFIVVHFNSRPSARGDIMDVRIYNQCIISIHAPPRGATAKDMQFLQIFCSTLTNQHGLTIMPRNLSRLFW